MTIRWKIKAAPEALKEFYELPTASRTRIREKLRYARECERITDLAAHLGKQTPGWYEIRVGKYRVVFEPTREGVELYLVYGTMNVFAVIKKKEFNRILCERWNKYHQ